MSPAPPRVLTCGDRALEIGARTFVMGVVNVTPDSFSDGGLHVAPAAAVDHALRLLDDGADVLDIGGESTRPGAAAVTADEESARVLPVVEALAARGVTNVSVDTRRAAVAAAALDAGASWVNDVSALADDPAMPAVAARAGAVVLMHRRPFTTTPGAAPGRHGDDASYGGDVVGAVQSFLAARVQAAVDAGVARGRIVVDPGIGFGKSVEDNVRLIKAAARLSSFGAVLVGPSRKRFLGALTGVDDPAARDAATLGAVAAAVFHGAHIVRVHDVRGAVQCAKVVDAVVRVR